MLQIALLCVCLVCMGGVLGVERALLPLMASDVFDEHGNTVTFAFIMTFGISKARQKGGGGCGANLAFLCILSAKLWPRCHALS